MFLRLGRRVMTDKCEMIFGVYIQISEDFQVVESQNSPKIIEFSQQNDDLLIYLSHLTQLT
jgi:hypothetical protein